MFGHVMQECVTMTCMAGHHEYTHLHSEERQCATSSAEQCEDPAIPAYHAALHRVVAAGLI